MYPQRVKKKKKKSMLPLKLGAETMQAQSCDVQNQFPSVSSGEEDTNKSRFFKDAFHSNLWNSASPILISLPHRKLPPKHPKNNRTKPNAS